MLSALILILTVLISGYLAFSKHLRGSSNWAATVTPLASIMGSGFLISAPLLAGVVGVYSLFCMAGLLVLAFGVGSAIRFNIRHFEPIENDGHGLPQTTALLSRIILSFAYFISISYYLQLLAAFSLNALNIEIQWLGNIITTTLLVVIAGLGMWRGLAQLEKMERYVISLNLGMVGALIVGLIWFNVSKMMDGAWALPAVDSGINFADFRVLLGLLIVVQGFETSRYLGANHSVDQRIQTMKRAQIISGVIYLLFIGLSTVLFHDGLGANVVDIISMVAPVAVVLPVLISVVAIGSQFSAAVADTSGAGGLLSDLSGGKMTARKIYLVILIITIALTWLSDVNEIIAYASRAFAAYYFLQCLVALFVAKKLKKNQTLLFATLALICLAVSVLGLPAE
ncbi:MAG: hypothetical protein ACSHX0_01855 [Akkermansiaceae bacterium]